MAKKTQLQIRQEETESLLGQCRNRIMATMPTASDMFQRRFFATAFALAKDPNLLGCTPRSMLGVIFNCARLGLIPDPNFGYVWIIPRRIKNEKEAQMQVGYLGRIELARRSGQIKAVRAKVIFQNDKTEYVDGLEQKLTHVPWDFCGQDESGPRIGSYCVATFADGTKDLRVVGETDIIASRDASAAYQSGTGPWISDENAMAAVVAIRRAAKLWPQDTTMALADDLDRRADMGETQADMTDLPISKADDLPEGKGSLKRGPVVAESEAGPVKPEPRKEPAEWEKTVIRFAELAGITDDIALKSLRLHAKKLFDRSLLELNAEQLVTINDEITAGKVKIVE